MYVGDVKGDVMVASRATFVAHARWIAIIPQTLIPRTGLRKQSTLPPLPLTLLLLLLLLPLLPHCHLPR